MINTFSAAAIGRVLNCTFSRRDTTNEHAYGVILGSRLVFQGYLNPCSWRSLSLTPFNIYETLLTKNGPPYEPLVPDVSPQEEYDAFFRTNTLFLHDVIALLSLSP